jgi:putative flavoprotein involved in K+ transport
VIRHVAILGAGPAGLAAAVCLRRHGISYAVLERGAAPAAGIRRIDPEMELLSPTRISLMPGMRRQPKDSPYLTFPAYAEKLERLSAECRIAVRTGAEVTRVTRSGQGFSVLLRDGSALDCTHVVSSTGIVSFPRLPPRFDAAAARYHWLHSIDVRTGDLAGARRLLVVGAGQSAAEVLERWLAHRKEGDRAWLSVRTRTLTLPHWVLGIDVHYLAWPLEFLPPRWLGLDPATFREPVLGLTLPRALRAGMIARVSEMRDYSGSELLTMDGDRVTPDLVVFATGFEYGLHHVRDVVGSGARWPRVRRCESTDAPGLYFLGLRHCRTLASAYLRGIGRDARAVAARIARS